MMTLPPLVTSVRVHVHTYSTFANPYLVCAECGATAHQWHNPGRCGCIAGAWTMPCQHTAITASVCPTWNPVDDCGCGPDWARIHEQTRKEVVR